MYEILPESGGNVVGIRATGTLTRDDYDQLAPYLEAQMAAHAPLRVLVLLDDWHGWDSLGALWQDVKLDAHLATRVERVAMVGDENWQRWATLLASPFTRGTVRYFSRDQMGAAWAWVREASPEAAR